MEESTLENLEHQPKKRPVFLTVLCILSFIGSGLAVISALPGLLFTNQTQTFYTLADSPLYRGGALPSLEDFLFWTNVSNIVNILSALLGLAGALLMWRLKKSGFFLYAFSWLVSVGVALVTTKIILAPFMGGLAFAIVGLNVVIMIAFLIMYGVNLKHMNA